MRLQALAWRVTFVYVASWWFDALRTATARKLFQASYFKDISMGQDPIAPRTVPANLCLYIKESCEISSKNWTDMRILLKPYVNLVTFKSLAQNTHQLMPDLVPFKDGFKASLLDVATKTLERLPEQISSSIAYLTYFTSLWDIFSDTWLQLSFQVYPGQPTCSV